MSRAEQPSATLKPIYDPRRAIEHIQTLSGVMPIRLYAILFPLWDVETTATQEDGRPYELMEKYVERGIDEGQLHSVEELATFFGLQSEMVKKILNFLNTIGHVTSAGGRWDLTPLGQKSVREGTRYVSKEKRTRLYFDAYSSKPLRKEHYNTRRVSILSPDEAAEVHYMKTWGYRFHLISNMTQWQPTALRELEARIDRGDYNVPPEMQGLQALSVKPAYIPMYIIETKKQSSAPAHSQGVQMQKPYYLVYTGIRDLRDTYFEHIINNSQTVYAALRGEKVWTPYDLWREWLDEKGITDVFPLERSDGTWQVSLPASVFEGPQAKFTTIRIGDYDLKIGYFMQIWCDDKTLRRKAALDRTLRMVKNQQQYIRRQTVQERLHLLVRQLQTSELTFADLQQRAMETGMRDMVNVLDNL